MDSDSWCTPPNIADPLEDFFGGPVDIDPCSNPNSIIRARRAYHAGGLHLPWKGTGYFNWPYSTNMPWVNKSLFEMHEGRCTEAVELMMVATSTKWWATNCGVMPAPSLINEKKWQPRNPRIIFTSRIKFRGDKTFGARFDTALVYFGTRHAAFERAFKHVTRWMSWGRSTRK